VRRKPCIADSDTNTDFSFTYHYPLHRIPASIKAQNFDSISLRPFLTEFSWRLHLGRSGEEVVGSDSEKILKEQMSKSVQIGFEITKYFISKSLTNVAK
jgi:hypothetical protein